MNRLEEKAEEGTDRTKAVAKNPWSELFAGMNSKAQTRAYARDEDLSYFPGQSECHGYLPATYDLRSEKRAA